MYQNHPTRGEMDKRGALDKGGISAYHRAHRQNGQLERKNRERAAAHIGFKVNTPWHLK
jgi:hypothetical protein